MSKEGFIFLHRKLEDWEWYDDANTMRLFIHCLLEANHTDKHWRGINIKRGQFITSQPKLANRLKLSVRQIRTALDKLKLTGELTVSTTSDYSVITINNYDDYQQNDRLNDRLMTGKRQANDRLMTTTNNDNNDNNENNIIVNREEKKLKNPFESPYIQTYQTVYKEVFNKRCYLLNEHRNRVIEIASELGEQFENCLYIVFKRLKFINFEEIGVKPDSAWLLSKDNFIKVLEGTFGTKEKEEEYIYNANN